MTLYEIDEEIASLVDPDTGEIEDFDLFDELSMEREKKLENVAKWIKNDVAMITAITGEIEKLTERKKKLAVEYDRLTDYLGKALDYTKFETGAVKVSFRKSEQVIIDVDENLLPADLMTEKVTRKPNKVAIKALLKNGGEVYGCHLETCQNVKVD